jgi:glutamyl-tRNA synthetase
MKGYPIVQWVPRRVAHKINLIITNRLFVDGKFNEDSLVVEEVAVEPHYLELADDTEIQFVRFGYCRKESGYRAIMTHR